MQSDTLSSNAICEICGKGYKTVKCQVSRPFANTE